MVNNKKDNSILTPIKTTIELTDNIFLILPPLYYNTKCFIDVDPRNS